jgi:carnitine 3-dehydrogenase
VVADRGRRPGGRPVRVLVIKYPGIGDGTGEGGGPGGLADFLVHLGPALEALWKTLGQASFDADTVRLLTTQAEDFGGTVAELARRRDEAQIRLMKALDEIAIEG